MVDNRSEEKRSQNMASIRNKDTKPEVFLRCLLFREGYRYRKNCKNMLGHPDLWLKKYNTVVFVNGCFWHMHKGCRYSGIPKSRSDYWKAKFDYNVKRDVYNQQVYIEKKVKVLVVWECAIKKTIKTKNERELLDLIESFLNTEELFLEIGEKSIA